MDVSDINSLDGLNGAAEAIPSAAEELGGETLLNTVVSLTGLPQKLMYEELDQILKLSPHKREAGDLTMQELRTALLAYLESLGESFGEEPMGELELSGIASTSDISQPQ